jgi:hypothetical protein
MSRIIVSQERGRRVRCPHAHSKTLDLRHENVPDIGVKQNFDDT